MNQCPFEVDGWVDEGNREKRQYLQNKDLNIS